MLPPLEWLKSLVLEGRILLDYRAHERKLRAEHRALATQRFDVEQIRNKIAAREERARREARSRFDGRILEADLCVAKLQTEISSSRAALAILTRPYKDELDALYAHREDLQQRRQDLIASKQGAFEQIGDAKAAIDRWYARSSRGHFFGNGGKKLPNHSLFGQSFGDLNAWKADRDAAGERIQSLKREIGDISQEISRNGDEIGQVKAERQQMFDLRKQGIKAEALQRAIKEKELTLRVAGVRRAQLASDKAIFLNAEYHRLEISGLQALAEQTAAAQKLFLQSFDHDSERFKRRHAHRAGWMQRHTA